MWYQRSTPFICAERSFTAGDCIERLFAPAGTRRVDSGRYVPRLGARTLAAVLEQSAARILARIDPGALVLDVGGAARPFPRADWILDLVPYEARGQLGWQGERTAERFGPDTWVTRDICERGPWPFAENQFDFAICSHTLEDVRDPVFVCAELQRVAKAGYVEVPSLREELTYGIQGPWVGWGHHHWLALVDAGGIEFVFKHHVVNRAGSHLPAGFIDGLSAEERAQTLWWEGGFEAKERFMLTAEELDSFLERQASAGRRPGARLRTTFRRARRRAARVRGRVRSRHGG